jgi:hypothetical protein
MKVELIQYFIRTAAQEFYSLKAPKENKNYALYLGEDDEHMWIHPIFIGTKDKVPFIYFGSVSRFMIGDIIIYDDEELMEYITDAPFGEMKHKGLSIFD